MSQSTDGAGNVTAEAAPVTPPRRAPWGIWLSLAWIVLGEEILRKAEGALVRATPLGALTKSDPFWRALEIIAAWSVPFITIIVAVRLTRWPLAEYLAWIRPRAKHVAFGIAVVLGWSLAQHGLAYLLTGSAQFSVEEYRAALAAGTTSWNYVMHWWPAIILAPIVEETMDRGFLWRGVASSRLGTVGALLVTSFVFAAGHYNYYFADGQIYLGTLGFYVIAGLIFGWIRWFSGSTIVTMIAHSFDNAWTLGLAAIVASALTP